MFTNKSNFGQPVLHSDLRFDKYIRIRTKKDIQESRYYSDT